MSTVITTETLGKALIWYDYERMVKQQVAEGKTTGEDQRPDLIEYSRINLQRMKRVGKTVTLKPELIQLLQDLPLKLIWVVMVESWCGDVANNLPLLNMMTDASPNIELHILLRDQNPDIMEAFLTNGARSIPKLICMNQDFKVLGTWGPKPAPLMALLKEYKSGPEPRMTYDEYARKVQMWYAADKGQTLQAEMLDLIRGWID